MYDTSEKEKEKNKRKKQRKKGRKKEKRRKPKYFMYRFSTKVISDQGIKNNLKSV